MDPAFRSYTKQLTKDEYRYVAEATALLRPLMILSTVVQTKRPGALGETRLHWCSTQSIYTKEIPKFSVILHELIHSRLILRLIFLMAEMRMLVERSGHSSDPSRSPHSSPSGISLMVSGVNERSLPCEVGGEVLVEYFVGRNLAFRSGAEEQAMQLCLGRSASLRNVHLWHSHCPRPRVGAGWHAGREDACSHSGSTTTGDSTQGVVANCLEDGKGFVW
jgi:hypothetical protein